MKKKTMKRNQIIIGALTVLLGVAGYINFSGNKLDLAPGELEPTESAFAEEQTETDAKPAEIVSGELTELKQQFHLQFQVLFLQQ